ncbi:hypothetical protein JOY44_07605 [Phormidium sp. CLA17]|uniref:hypothetical protein n=1 Tax=Leptolyngbya sp. Cla-17 TaxID=2803751 RepID=UPI00149318AA|nr:hypothetical protein [Leptolyngbya sp. Cla-17]MBM0741480.1 hypothetical protein [Leptolyngbya sp. Cla-17]
MFVSSFELLVKPIAPPPFNSAVSRRAVQAYFLTISNLNPVGVGDVSLSVQFTATPGLNNDELIAIVDAGGGNIFSDLVPDPVTGKPSQQITLPSGVTALVVLQPDLSKAAPNPASIEVASLEVRGYVELSLSPFSANTTAEILVTPQIRGTFIPADLTAPSPDFDQQSYTLPTANPGAIIKF